MLRNALDARLSHRQHRRGRDQEWYDGPSVPLTENALKDIVQARRRAGRGSRAIPRGKIIAELGFGFWRYLLARQYRANLWPDLAGAFPHAPRRSMDVIEAPVKRLHQLRNRIAHHEGVWHLPLEARHADLHTVLGAIDPAATAWVARASRIDDVLARRPQPR